MPWVKSLTKRNIGQLWIHHTGLDESRGYGDKTKEWQLDAVMHLTRKKRADTDVSFDLTFQKKRECTPDKETTSHPSASHWSMISGMSRSAGPNLAST